VRRHVIWRAEEPVSTIVVGRDVKEVLADFATSRPRRRVAILNQPPTVNLATVYSVAGFIGGTYLRGVAVMYVATTLVGAVDAAIGGKTGVNVDGKNMAGVFAHPEAVFVDIDILDQLPISLKREGAAEALKVGFIEDMRIVEAYEAAGLDVDLESIVNRSVAVKVAKPRRERIHPHSGRGSRFAFGVRIRGRRAAAFRT